MAAQSTGVRLSMPSDAVVARTAAQFSDDDANRGWLPWQAFRRKLDREQPDYKL